MGSPIGNYKYHRSPIETVVGVGDKENVGHNRTLAWWLAFLLGVEG